MRKNLVPCRWLLVFVLAQNGHGAFGVGWVGGERWITLCWQFFLFSFSSVTYIHAWLYRERIMRLPFFFFFFFRLNKKVDAVVLVGLGGYCTGLVG